MQKTGCISCLFAWISLVFSSPGQMSQGEEWRKKPSLPQSCSHLKVVTIIRSIGCKQTTLRVARHTLVRRGLPSSKLRGLGVNKLYLTKFMDICQHSLWVVQLTNTHFSTLDCRYSIHFSAFNLQAIGEFRGKHLPRYRLFFMGCSLGPRVWGPGCGLIRTRLHIVNVTLNFFLLLALWHNVTLNFSSSFICFT